MEDHEHYIGTIKQVSDFEATAKFIVNNAQENFDNSLCVSETLIVLNYSCVGSWRMITQASKAEDEATRERVDMEFDYDCKGKPADHLKLARTKKTLIRRAHCCGDVVRQTCVKE